MATTRHHKSMSDVAMPILSRLNPRFLASHTHRFDACMSAAMKSSLYERSQPAVDREVRDRSGRGPGMASSSIGAGRRLAV